MGRLLGRRVCLDACQLALTLKCSIMIYDAICECNTFDVIRNVIWYVCPIEAETLLVSRFNNIGL